MKNKDYNVIAESIWRSGYIKKSNKIKQEAGENMRRLIANDLMGGFKKDKDFDEITFLKKCGF